MILKRLGTRNMDSTDKEWRVEVRLPDDAPAPWIGQHWARGDEPIIDGMAPSEVVELISERLESYVISTRLDADRKTIEWVRENAARLDLLWASEEEPGE